MTSIEILNEQISRHEKIILKVTYLYAKGNEERQDLAQDIYLQLWKAFPKFDPERNFSTWMYRIALNVAITHFRQQTRYRNSLTILENDYPSPSGNHDQFLEEQEELAKLDELISLLNPFDRALTLLYLEDKSYAEIGTILGMTSTNVSTKISRIKQNLRKQNSITK